MWQKHYFIMDSAYMLILLKLYTEYHIYTCGEKHKFNLDSA